MFPSFERHRTRMRPSHFHPQDLLRPTASAHSGLVSRALHCFAPPLSAIRALAPPPLVNYQLSTVTSLAQPTRSQISAQCRKNADPLPRHSSRNLIDHLPRRARDVYDAPTLAFELDVGLSCQSQGGTIQHLSEEDLNQQLCSTR
jgi:hypothetical protein